MKLIQLNYHTLDDLTADVAASGLTADLVSIVPDADQFAAIVRVTDQIAKNLEFMVAAERAHAHNARTLPGSVNVTALLLAVHAMEYHTQQTRPIERTDEAMAALRKVLTIQGGK